MGLWDILADLLHVEQRQPKKYTPIKRPSSQSSHQPPEHFDHPSPPARPLAPIYHMRDYRPSERHPRDPELDAVVRVYAYLRVPLYDLEEIDDCAAVYDRTKILEERIRKTDTHPDLKGILIGTYALELMQELWKIRDLDDVEDGVAALETMRWGIRKSCVNDLGLRILHRYSLHPSDYSVDLIHKEGESYLGHYRS